ncbi:MAG: acetylornithine deacetylase [Pseudomonadota bacterium]
MPAPPTGLTAQLASDAIDILERLIAFDTTSSLSNLALIAYVETYLADLGVDSRRVTGADDKANLIATIGGAGDGGIVLSGHTDVVPVTDQPWTMPPFQLTRRDGRLYGRGTSDMKSFIALALAAVPHLAGRRLSRPIHLAFSYDEEIGCLGVGDLIGDLLQECRPTVVIVGEPTEMRIVDSHKSVTLYEVVVTGVEAHSSLSHEGISANMIAVELMHILVRIAEEEERFHHDPRFAPPWSTLTIGVIQGGTATNILARECRFAFDLRTIPDRSADDILAPFWAAVEQARARLAERAETAGITIRRLADVPALRQETDGEAQRLCTMLSGTNTPGVAVAFGAEAGHFQQAGMSTVICGPGSIEQAHRPDEFIEVSQIEAGARFMARLVAFVRD